MYHPDNMNISSSYKRPCVLREFHQFVAWHYLCSWMIFFLFISGCLFVSPIRSFPQADASNDKPRPGVMLFLSQAQFIEKKGKDGKVHPMPGPARLMILTSTQDGWKEEVIEDNASNVFHKAAWWNPSHGEPGILTIGATGAFLKIWRQGKDGWVAETLWNPTFGGRFDRLRDFEVADVTGDGVEDIVVATHDQGVVAVVSRKGDTWEATELCRSKDTFVHEIEVGDVDGDGTVDIFSTPSAPNLLDGTPQPGKIERWRYEDGVWKRSLVEEFATRHVKEILCARIAGESPPVLFASLEGEFAGGETTSIRMYRFDGEASPTFDIAGLPGKLCRFLTIGDSDGDGTRELIASTNKSGVWKLIPTPKGSSGRAWEKTLIADDTSGFEHATCLFDADGDGTEEIYVASDDQKELRCYRFDGKGYTKRVVREFKGDFITFNLTAALPSSR